MLSHYNFYVNKLIKQDLVCNTQKRHLLVSEMIKKKKTVLSRYL